MKSAMRVSVVLLVWLGITAGPAFAQGLSPKRIWVLTVTVNAPNAVVYVDNVLAPGGRTQVTGGAHNVRVHADGYSDYNGPVVVSGNITFPVTLTPLGFPLTIRVAAPGARVILDGMEVTGTVPIVSPGAHQVQVTASGYFPYTATLNVMGPMSFDVPMQQALSLVVNVNVPNAQITVDNAPVSGNAAAVTPGPHSLIVHADGYQDWNGMVNVQRSMTFSVSLTPAGFALTVRVATPGATIFVDGANVTGTVPAVAPGSHQVTVTAPGYMDYNATVNVTAPFTMDVVLQSANAVISFVIPPALRDPGINPSDPRAQVRVYIDNQLVGPGLPLSGITVAPGPHAIRVASGAFSAQLGSFVAQPGQSYVVQLAMGLSVQPAQGQ
jgi:hypothetical protein